MECFASQPDAPPSPGTKNTTTRPPKRARQSSEDTAKKSKRVRSSARNPANIKGTCEDEKDALIRALGVPVPDVDNVVASFYLGVRFTEKEIERLRDVAFPGSTYKTKKFSALVLSGLQDGLKISFQIFKTGNVLLHGKSVKQIHRVSCRIVRRIRRFGHTPSLIRFRICNVVQSTQLPFSVNLDVLSYTHSKYVNYVKDDFPGLTYRLESRHGSHVSASLTLFPTGRILIRSRNSDKDFIHQIFSCLMPHFKANQIPTPGKQKKK